MEMEISFPGGARVDASFEGFLIATDQSLESGGQNSAPAPFALFLASIGTCAGIYILRFCQQRSIPTENIRIRQLMDRDPKTGMVEQISIEILLPPDFPAKYARALIKTAELCTVKKHLENPPSFHIETRLAE